jgi:hypothetical protein
MRLRAAWRESLAKCEPFGEVLAILSCREDAFMINRSRPIVRLLAGVLLVASGGTANALPIADPLDDPFSGLMFDFGRGISIFTNEAWRYDAVSGLLSYEAGGAFEYRTPGLVSPFMGSLTWQAHVDGAGNLLDAGSMALMGDFGSGSHMLASGTLLDIGFQSHGSCTAGIGCDLISFRAIFDNSLLDASISDIGQRMGLFFELAFVNGTPSPFTGDFSCGFAGDPACPMFSTSGLTSIRVPEPGTLPLAVLAACALAGAMWPAGRRLLRLQQ